MMNLMMELSEHINGGAWHIYYDTLEIGHTLTFAYNLIKWMRDETVIDRWMQGDITTFRLIQS
jgi:hypothetical protein